jgi:endonuclease/exonuclease/phosphatase family metal-dependent hydrolase
VEPFVRSDSLRIATWNIASNRNYGAIIARIAQLNIDICAVQEVLLDPAIDLPAMFGHGEGNHQDYRWHFAPALTPEDLGSGKLEYYGLAVLSRIALSRTAAFQLGPKNATPPINAEGEMRMLQVVAPQLERSLLVGNTHLASTEDWSLSAVRRSQARRIADILGSLAKPDLMILCGDFNTGPSSSDLTELREVLPHVHASKEATFVGEPGRPPIDFFCSSAALKMDISVFPPDGLSDHNIVVAIL